jgi:3D (Asp-Asp-Asp) domain-containing protein
MRRMAMSLALQAALAALIVMSATRVSIPSLRPGGLDSCPASLTEVSIPGRICRTPASRVVPAGSTANRLEVTLPTRRTDPLPQSAHPTADRYGPARRFKLTAYSGPQLGQGRPITATGTVARAGRTVAVDPAVIPLGSRIHIEGLGERIAEDVGGAVKGHHIDVYLPSGPEARRFGIRRGTVRLIAPGGRAG